MIASEVQRTLVKSPPELWAELSDPAALARHLGELGEIRITKVKPEQSVEWEAEAAKGKVELKPSGWGTKVTLSVVQELPESAPGDAGSTSPEAKQPIKETEPIDLQPKAPRTEEPAKEPAEMEVAQPVATEAESGLDELQAAEPVEAEPVEAEPVEAEPPADEVQAAEPIGTAPEERPGFFARLFRRKGKAAKSEPEPEQSVVPEPEQTTVPKPEQPAVPEEEALAEDEAAPKESAPTGGVQAPEAPIAADDANTPAETLAPAQTPQDQAPSGDLSAELAAAEEALGAQTTELLTMVLDRLGAAHHRPFSRA